MGIIMKFIGISKKNNAQKREHNLFKPTQLLVLHFLTSFFAQVAAIIVLPPLEQATCMQDCFHMRLPVFNSITFCIGSTCCQ